MMGKRTLDVILNRLPSNWTTRSNCGIKMAVNRTRAETKVRKNMRLNV